MIVNQDAGAMLMPAAPLAGAAPARPLDNAGQAGWLYQLEHAMLTEAAPGNGAPAAAPGRQATGPNAGDYGQPGATAAPMVGAPATGAAPAWSAWALNAAFAAPAAPGMAAGAFGAGAMAASQAEAAPGAASIATAAMPPRPGGAVGLAVLARGAGAAGNPAAGETANETTNGAADTARAALDGRAASLAAAADEAYAAAKLHIYQDGAGVQAWIRDAALGATQAPGLLRSMAAQLGADGARLSALTVNGKTVAAPAARADQFIQSATTDGGPGTAPSDPSSYAQGAA